MSDFKKFCIDEKLSPVQIVGARKAWQEQQARVDELQKLRGLDEMAISQIAHANQQWQLKCDELQKRIDKALSVTGNYCDEDDAALLIYVLEKALRGES